MRHRAEHVGLTLYVEGRSVEPPATVVAAGRPESVPSRLEAVDLEWRAAWAAHDFGERVAA